MRRENGHVVKNDSCLKKDIISGYSHGRRSVGRQRKRWIEVITERITLKITETVRITENTNRDDSRHQGLVVQHQILNFYVSYGHAARFLRSGDIY